jgi:uncharacterized protein DUF1116
VKVLNVGIASFLPGLAASGTPVTAAEWRPPARGRADLAWKVARLLADPAIDDANAEAFRRMTASRPVLAGAALAREVIPALAGGEGGRLLLHAGPPLAWGRAAGPVRGALVGAVLWEGWAATPAEAEGLLASGAVAMQPCHHHGAVGPMAGVTSPSMPVWIVADAATGGRAFCNFNEGLGKVLRFGAHGPDVLARLSLLRDAVLPAVEAALSALGPLELKPLMARALHMGDELHNRNAAATALLARALAPALVRADVGAEAFGAVFGELAANDHFFLNLSMAAAKLAADAARGVPRSTLCTAMARNATDFGIQVSGLPGRWFTAPAPAVQGLFFAGYGPADAAPDLGDSAITETVGLGGMSLAAAPAIVRFVGGSAAAALEGTRRMFAICHGEHPELTLPALDFRGAPTGIDARLVVDLNRAPTINTGIAHRQAGVGQIGAGITSAPLACFEQAVEAMEEREQTAISR